MYLRLPKIYILSMYSLGEKRSSLTHPIISITFSHKRGQAVRIKPLHAQRWWAESDDGGLNVYRIDLYRIS